MELKPIIVATFETSPPVFVNHVAAIQRKRNEMNVERLTTWFIPEHFVDHALEFGVYTVYNRKSLTGKELHLEITLEAAWGQIGARRPIHT